MSNRSRSFPSHHGNERTRLQMNTVPCPHCGGEIREDAKFCRHCGSSDSDGWRDEFDEGEEEFDYDSFVEDEFPSGLTNEETSPLWRFVAVVLLLLLAGFVLSSLRLF